MVLIASGLNKHCQNTALIYNVRTGLNEPLCRLNSCLNSHMIIEIAGSIGRAFHARATARNRYETKHFFLWARQSPVSR